MEIQTWKPFFKEGDVEQRGIRDLLEGRHKQRVVPQRMLLITQWVKPQWRNGEKSCTQSTSKQRLLR